ncbi:MAG: 50S ribosomal protein L4, partial [Bacteroidota bacterium]
LVLAKSDDNVFLSSRNLKRVKVVHACDLNTYEILDATQLLITADSVKEIEKIHQN